MGCGKEYNEDENKDMVCSFHPGAPKFHEGQKSWTCCESTNRPVLTFEEFQAIPGCAYGTHTSEKATPAKPVVTAPSAINKGAGAGTQSPAPSLAPPTPALGTSRTPTPAPPVEVEDEDDLTVSVTPGTMCKRSGCRKTFVSDEVSRQGDGEEAQCTYHAKEPLFHEGSKGYVCCKKHVLDFDDFLAIPGCKTGRHVFASKAAAASKSEESIVQSRIDHYQTPTEVRVSVFAKQADQSRSTVTFEVDKILLDLFLPANKRDKRAIALFGTIDPVASSYKFYGTKVEVVLVKTDNRSWNALQADAVVPAGYQLTFGVTGRTGTVGAKDAVLDDENKAAEP